MNIIEEAELKYPAHEFDLCVKAKREAFIAGATAASTRVSEVKRENEEMREKMKDLNDAYNIVVELAQWSHRYPRSQTYHYARKDKMDGELIALEEKAKQLLNK